MISHFIDKWIEAQRNADFSQCAESCPQPSLEQPSFFCMCVLCPGSSSSVRSRSFETFERWKIVSRQVGRGWGCPHLCWPLSPTVLTSKDRDKRWLSGLRKLLHIVQSHNLSLDSLSCVQQALLLFFFKLPSCITTVCSFFFLVYGNSFGKSSSSGEHWQRKSQLVYLFYWQGCPQPSRASRCCHWEPLPLKVLGVFVWLPPPWLVLFHRPC